MKISKLLCVSAVLTMTLLCFASCEKGTSEQTAESEKTLDEVSSEYITSAIEDTTGEFITTDSEEATAAQTVKEEKVGHPLTYKVYHKTCYNAALDWNRQQQQIEGTSDYAWWNITGCQKMKINFLNVFPNYRLNGTSITGASLMGDNQKDIVQYTAPALEASHKSGITMVTSLPMCLLRTAAYEQFNIDWKQYSSVKANGDYSMSSDGATAYACINNPLFQQQVRKATLVAAEGGFDGMFYDANPYAYGVKFNCCCKYCREEWAAYSKEKTGAEIPLLTTEPNLSKENERLFWQWRLDNYIDFVLDVQKECQKINPDFSVWPNLGINGTTQCYYTLKGMQDLMCEYGTNTVVEPGADSTLYFFRQYEAENPEKQLMTQFNSISSQASPDYKWYTAYVEAIAGNGALMVPTSTKGTVTFFNVIDACNTIKENDPEAFTDSASAANVAVMYSWQNINAFTLKSTGTLSFAYNPSRKVAGALAGVGIPFDYIIAEKNPTLEDLNKYSSIIIPDQYIIEKDFEAVLTEYLNAGGQVLILGSAFGDYYTETYGVKYAKRGYSIFEKWTGKKLASDISGTVFEVGKGKVEYIKNYVAGLSDKVAVTNDVFLKAMEDFNMYELVRVTEDIAGKVETTLRSDADGSRWWLHLITYNSAGVYDNKPITVTVTIPEGQTVSAVTGVSPTVSAAEMQLSWKQEGDKLTISAVIGLWTMIRIDKK